MFKITKQFGFSASHQLSGLAPDHPCSRLHGHNYLVEVELRSAHLNAVGFVRDYRELDSIKRYIDEELDHRHLNDVMGRMNPTAENIAGYLYHLLLPDCPELYAVRISETSKTWAEYRSDVRKGEIEEILTLESVSDRLQQLEKLLVEKVLLEART